VTEPRSTSQGVDVDVAVVGYGPVGATLAVLLAQTGRSVVILERQPALYALPRAVHMDDHVTRIFQSCGLGPDLPHLTEPASVYEWRNASGTTLLRIGRDGVGAGGWPVSSMFHQPALERALRRRVGELGVDVRLGHEVSGLRQGQEQVEVTTSDGPTFRARYVVGCDGANSTVRGLVGLDLVDLGFSSDWLIVDVVLDHHRVFDPLNQQVCDPARPTTAVSGGPGRRRWEFMRLPHESLEELNSRQQAWSLLAGWDVHPGNAVIERHAVYTFAARVAPSWRSGSVLLAGDAAHQMPPFAGQGMCAGIRDTANLAWKLDMVLTGRATPDLLDTYDLERRVDVRTAIDFSVELGKVICIPDPEEAAERDAAMTSSGGGAIEPPPLPPLAGGVIAAATADAGHTLPQGRTDAGRFDDLHGVGWLLILRPGATDASDAAPWFQQIGGRIVTVGSDDTVWQGWFAERDCSAVLCRPDFYAFGTAGTTDDLSALLAALRSSLQTPDPATSGAPS
jgi:flavoprotein hydroxylase